MRSSSPSPHPGSNRHGAGASSWPASSIATALRIALSLFAVKLLAIIGLTLAGGILLLWVAWKLYRELHDEAPSAAAGASAPAKSFGRALFQVVAADLSMSLDNALAVAGTARDHFIVLVIGLLLSVGLMALAASMVARLMARYRWLAWLGVAIVAAVALRLIYDGSADDRGACVRRDRRTGCCRGRRRCRRGAAARRSRPARRCGRRAAPG